VPEYTDDAQHETINIDVEEAEVHYITPEDIFEMLKPIMVLLLVFLAALLIVKLISKVFKEKSW